MPGALAYAEIREGAVSRASREAVGLARRIAADVGGETHVVALGPPGTEEAVAQLAGFGADRTWVGESEALALCQPDIAAAAIARLVEAGDYNAVIFAATAQGRDIAPRVGARLGRSVASEVIECRREDGAIVVRRPMYAGKAIATLRFTPGPAVMTIRANVFAPVEESAAGEISSLDLPSLDGRARTAALEQGDRDRLDVSEATTIVSGGRGMQGPEHWPLLEALVEALGDEAALGASRAVVDAGWRPHGEQVGQTGKTVSPNLYFAVGISGAIQHLAGMRTAKVIVAINRDADAPIFGVADYGLVGDVFEVLPALTQAVREARQGD
ncbi:electron transfer flavoprotein subunit alpha/FixB family protein [Candidatus Palauibacter sp.]|uniref:electron transfer flavoprotein subunit alpha/FixB family protein n=1 Tax=Candidatus Palauibacter sp. TaxID=3101350 RepID=UPI003B02A6D9